MVEEPEAGNPGRELRLSAKGNLHGEWDPDRLAQVFGNLGKNALAYSPEDIPVDFVLRHEGGCVSVEVCNGGAPIPADRLPHVFEPFRGASETPALTSSGLGLGLFIVREIVTAHGVIVEVRSTAVEGTRFTVRLPRRCGDASRP